MERGEKKSCMIETRLGAVRQGRVRQGLVGSGLVRLGRARSGLAWLCKARIFNFLTLRDLPPDLAALSESRFLLADV